MSGQPVALPLLPGAAAGSARWTPPEPPPLVVDGRSARLVVHTVALACCALEVATAVQRVAAAAGPSGADDAADRPVVDVLVVAGTVTDRLAGAVLARWDALPARRAAVSFGACANSGGPYWDSWSVTKGVDQLLPVDVWVPGCPPRPEDLLRGLRALDELLRDRA